MWKRDRQLQESAVQLKLQEEFESCHEAKLYRLSLYFCSIYLSPNSCQKEKNLFCENLRILSQFILLQIYSKFTLTYIYKVNTCLTSGQRRNRPWNPNPNPGSQNPPD